MAPRPILTWPDPRLRALAAPVTEFGPVLARLAEDMLETMYAAPGRGLAGPQVGAMQRIFVMDTVWKEGSPAPRICINPEILAAEGTVEMAEGCLSLPGLSVPVQRPARVRLRWQDLAGGWQEEWFEGIDAVCAQHERDHLDGILHIDRASAGIRAALEPEIAALAARAGDLA